jgi:hypothetical protein
MKEHLDKVWKKFLSKHWQMFVVWIVAAILAIIGAIYVFLWHVGEAQLTGLVPVLLGSWSMGHIITFLLHLIFWEAIFIGIPVLIAILAVYLLWWKKLPDKERKEYRKGHLFGKRSKGTDAGGGISFLIFIAFCILVYLDGNWGVAISTWEFDYLVYTCIWAFIWVAIIIGIPVLIGGSAWLYHQMKKQA